MTARCPSASVAADAKRCVLLKRDNKIIALYLAATLSFATAVARAAPRGDLGDFNDFLNTGNILNFFVAEQIVYDTNVYRLPSNVVNLEEVLGRPGSRQDFINTASVGLDAQFEIGRQDFLANIRLDDNRFHQNDYLNNVSGAGKLIWNWHVGSVFSGDAGALYTRSLAGFAATGYLGRDLIDKAEYFGDARYQLGPHWVIIAGVDESQTTNSAFVEQVNNSRRRSGGAGVEYAFSAVDLIGIDYRYAAGAYTDAYAMLNGTLFDRDYRDNSLRLLLKHEFTEKTSVDASVGYLKRDYPNATVGSFSGNVWSIAIPWEITEKTRITLTGSRDLDANLGAESNYFVSQGGTISPSWAISERITMSATSSWFDQNYIRATSTIFVDAPRRDKVVSQNATLLYTPIPSLTFTMSYKYERRSSNQMQFSFNDSLATLAAAFKFGRISNVTAR